MGKDRARGLPGRSSPGLYLHFCCICEDEEDEQALGVPEQDFQYQYDPHAGTMLSQP